MHFNKQALIRSKKLIKLLNGGSFHLNTAIWWLRKAVNK